MTDVDIAERLTRLEEALATEEERKKKAEAAANHAPVSYSEWIAEVRAATAADGPASRLAAQVKSRAEALVSEAGFERSLKCAYPEPSATSIMVQAPRPRNVHDPMHPKPGRGRPDIQHWTPTTPRLSGVARQWWEEVSTAINALKVLDERLTRARKDANSKAVESVEAEIKHITDQLARYGFTRKAA